MGSACSVGPGDESEIQTGDGGDVQASLQKILEEHPYIRREVHPLRHWVRRAHDSIQAGRHKEAADHIQRIQTELRMDAKRLRAMFEKFDLDMSGSLEIMEFRHFVTYVGFGPEIVDDILMKTDRNKDGLITFEEFTAFVGNCGGAHTLFENRRNAAERAGDRRRDAGHSIGTRVRSYYYDGPLEDRVKSASVGDARVLELTNNNSVKLEFNLLGGKEAEQQVVPAEFIEESIDLIEALQLIGVTEEAQHYWTILLPSNEQNSALNLVACQRKAIYGVRLQAISSHNEVLPELMNRALEIGLTREELFGVLTWIRDDAPVIVHLNLDKVGKHFLEDTHYRNQFETATSGGVLVPEIRERWEHNLFGDSYDNAKPSERPKYGVLDVMNDHRGVISCRDYGDSYMMLVNTRLRCTFSPQDSGGIEAGRLAVLDQYAHVLMEFNDDELKEVSRVANAQRGSEERIGDSERLNGFHYKEAQIHGEIDLKKHVKRLVVHPRHRVDGMPESEIRKLCAQKSWNFQWMDEERTRRIREERHAVDNKVLDASWRNERVIELGNNRRPLLDF